MDKDGIGSCQSLEEELTIGKNAATFLVEHMLRMCASRVEIPIVVNGCAYVVSCREQ